MGRGETARFAVCRVKRKSASGRKPGRYDMVSGSEEKVVVKKRNGVK